MCTSQSLTNWLLKKPAMILWLSIALSWKASDMCLFSRTKTRAFGWLSSNMLSLWGLIGRRNSTVLAVKHSLLLVLMEPPISMAYLQQRKQDQFISQTPDKNKGRFCNNSEIYQLILKRLSVENKAKLSQMKIVDKQYCGRGVLSFQLGEFRFVLYR